MVMQLAFPRLMGCDEKLPRHTDWGRGVYFRVFTGWKGGIACEARTQHPVSSSTIFHLIFEIESLVEPGAFPLTWRPASPQDPPLSAYAVQC